MSNPYDYPVPPSYSVDAMVEAFNQRQQHSDLHSKIDRLCEEITALRAELKPVSSLIATGADVAAEFKRLSAKGKA